MLSPALGVSQEGLTRPMSRSTDAPQIASQWSTRGSPPTKAENPQRERRVRIGDREGTPCVASTSTQLRV